MKKHIPLLLAAILCVASLTAMLFALNRETETGEFTPPPFDAAAEMGVPKVPEELGYTELDCRAYTVALCGKLGADGQLWLTNPESNSVWLKLRVLDENGDILGETGLIKPGEFVKTVALNRVPKSGTPITLKIMAYEPDTYYSAGAASLNTAMR